MGACFCTFTTDTGTTYNAVEASMTLTRGISPSYCNMTVPDRDWTGLKSIKSGPTTVQGVNGTLSMSDGVNGTVAFYDCRVLDFTTEQDANADYRTTMRIADRRWRWRGAQLSAAELNSRDAQGTVVDVGDFRASAWAIGTWLLTDALGESGSYDVQLPGGTTVTPYAYPYFRWERAAPTGMLHDLCELYDAQVVVTPNTNMVRVFADGSSLPAPSSAQVYSRQQYTFLGEPTPKNFMVYGGRCRVELDFPLTPVVLDVDGSLKSYGLHDSAGSRITSGDGTRDCSWLPSKLPPAEATPLQFSAQQKYAGADNAILRAQVQKCAAESYLRWYQMPGTATICDEDGTWYTYAPTLYRLIKLERNELERVDQEIRYAKSWVHGTGWGKHESADSSVATMSRTGVFTGGYSFDASSGVVKLSKPVWFNVGTTKDVGPGTLWLRAVYEDVPAAWYGTASSLDGSLVSVEDGYYYSEVHDDLVYEYGSAGTNDGTCRNLELMGSLGRSYIEAMGAKYARQLETSLGITTTYPGIHAFGVDGYRQQVTWSLGVDKPPFTVVSIDTDHDVRASSDLDRQSAWQGKLWRDRQSRAQETISAQFSREGETETD